MAKPTKKLARAGRKFQVADFCPDLRKGASDAGNKDQPVKALQKASRTAGFSSVRVHGRFDSATDSAVRRFQQMSSMLPDGIASTTVLSALEQYNRTRKHGSHVNYDAGKYPFVLQILWGMPGLIDSSALVSYPTASLSTSDDGGALMLYDETHDNYSVTSFLHFPDPEHCATDASGVTLGPGYDMGSRTEQKIVADLTAKGVDVDLVSAIQASKAAKLKSCDANDFVKKNVGIIKINLKEKQQIALMKRYLPPYEKWVRDIIRVDLLQREFDALTSLSANSAGVLGHVCHLINSGNVAEALGTIMEATGNNPGTKAGLKKRRSREVEFYLTGKFTREEKNVSSRMPHHAHQAK